MAPAETRRSVIGARCEALGVKRWRTLAAMTELAAQLRVVVVVIDAMPHRYVDAALTPNLWRQGATGGRAPDGGRSLPVSVTYANHAALITGAAPASTGIHGNHAWDDDRGWVSAPKEGPRATTLFDLVADAGGRSVTIVGDHKLIGQMAGGRADHVWPPGGWIPDGTERCEFGYPADPAVVAEVQAADLHADLVVLHLNQPDTTSHLYGPDSPEAIDRYRSTDAAYGQLIAELADGWEHTIVVTVSDHDQETINDQTPVPLAEALAGIAGISVADEGTAALIHGPVDDDVRATIDAVPGVDGTEQLAADIWMAWSEPGRMFGAPPIELRGQHGSPRCRTQVAIVSGGDARVRAIAEQIELRRPSVLDWAPTIADLLGVGDRS